MTPNKDDHGLDDLFSDEKSHIDAPSDEAEAKDLDVFATGDACPLPPLDTVGPTAAPDSPTLPVGPAGEPWPASAAGPVELEGHTRYRIVRLLGQGGMGAVYQAEHTLMDRPVALKVVHRHLTDNPAAAERFRREVRAAARLNHPNIVASYDADEAEGLHFLVMEYVEGQSLGDLLRRDGRLPIDVACDLIRQAAVGLQFAHEQGMVHRDVKPDNLMITAGGRVKILDFGLARFARGGPGEPAPQASVHPAVHSQLTLAGTLMGTPDYMAPEQSDDSSKADVRADVYSLGCTLYQALTGRVPFPTGTAMERITYHATETPTPVRQLRDDVPEELAAVVEKMMAKSPGERYQTPAEVAEALAPFAPRPAAAVGGAPPRWGPQVVIALIAAAALLLVLALIGWLR